MRTKAQIDEMEAFGRAVQRMEEWRRQWRALPEAERNCVERDTKMAIASAQHAWKKHEYRSELRFIQSAVHCSLPANSTPTKDDKERDFQLLLDAHAAFKRINSKSLKQWIKDPVIRDVLVRAWDCGHIWVAYKILECAMTCYHEQYAAVLENPQPWISIVEKRIESLDNPKEGLVKKLYQCGIVCLRQFLAANWIGCLCMARPADIWEVFKDLHPDIVAACAKTTHQLEQKLVTSIRIDLVPGVRPKLYLPRPSQRFLKFARRQPRRAK